jgi:hypothetical protein
MTMYVIFLLHITLHIEKEFNKTINNLYNA